MKGEILVLVIISVLTLIPTIVLGQNNNVTTTRTKLRIAIPIREFSQFVTVGRDPTSGENNYSGFAIEVFTTVMASLPSPVSYEFVAFDKPDGTMNGTFDDMLQAVSSKDYDGAVGDISILFYRTEWVDFTMPYLESSITMLVPINQQPTSKVGGYSLITTTLAFAITTFCISVISTVGYGCIVLMAFKLPGSRYKIKNLGSRMHTRLLMMSFFVILIALNASYIISQASSLTSQDRRGTVKNLTQLIRMGSNVGYREGSFVYNLLVIKGFLKSKLVSLKTEEEMVDMLSKGTSKGGVDAIVANAPHLKLLQSKHCNVFTTVPTTNLHATGFGFAFGKGSTIIDDISRAILKLVDNGQLGKIKDRTLGSLEPCQDDPDNNDLDVGSLSLGADHSAVFLFGIIWAGVLVFLSFICLCPPVVPPAPPQPPPPPPAVDPNGNQANGNVRLPDPGHPEEGPVPG